MTDLMSPCERKDYLGDQTQLERLFTAIDQNNLLNGWLVTGGEGTGKATLAYLLARRLLGNSEQSNNLVANASHPDLFVAERLYDEKKGVYASEIKIETIRKLNSFLNHTPSMGGWRIAIIDTADDLNRNAANALLKVLEEPPQKTTLFLLSASPGRLLPTIRSRCRKIDLRPLSGDKIRSFLEGEGLQANDEVIAAAKGRPGYAASLVGGPGADAIKLANEFVTKAPTGDIMPIVQLLSLKSNDELWPYFKSFLLQGLNDAIRIDAISKDSNTSIESMIKVYDEIGSLFAKGEAINTDRGQMLLQAARLLSRMPDSGVARGA